MKNFYDRMRKMTELTEQQRKEIPMDVPANNNLFGLWER